MERQGGPVETLETSTGAVLEMVGRESKPAVPHKSQIHSADWAFARRSATIEYADGLNAIPM